MDNLDQDKLAEFLMKGCIMLFEMLEDIHKAKPMICMTAKTVRGEYTIKITRDNDEN